MGRESFSDENMPATLGAVDQPLGWLVGGASDAFGARDNFFSFLVSQSAPAEIRGRHRPSHVSVPNYSTVLGNDYGNSDG